MPEKPESENDSPRIVIMPDGSYHVFGDVPLVHKTQVVSEYGEPLTWKKIMNIMLSKRKARSSTGCVAAASPQINPFAMAHIMLSGLTVQRRQIPI